MSVIDYLSVGVPDIESGRNFYDPVMQAADVRCLAANGKFAAYGKDRIEFLLTVPYDGGPQSGGNGTHIALAAASRAAVDTIYNSALTNGGRDEGAPGPRDTYPMPDVYTGYVRDPFGNKLEIIHNGFSG